MYLYLLQLGWAYAKMKRYKEPYTTPWDHTIQNTSSSLYRKLRGMLRSKLRPFSPADLGHCDWKCQCQYIYSTALFGDVEWCCVVRTEWKVRDLTSPAQGVQLPVRAEGWWRSNSHAISKYWNAYLHHPLLVDKRCNMCLHNCITNGRGEDVHWTDHIVVIRIGHHHSCTASAGLGQGQQLLGNHQEFQSGPLMSQWPKGFSSTPSLHALSAPQAPPVWIPSCVVSPPFAGALPGWWDKCRHAVAVPLAICQSCLASSKYSTSQVFPCQSFLA